MNKRRRRILGWGVVGILLVLVMYCAWRCNYAHDAHITWRYRPATQPGGYVYYYLRPQGGCYAIDNYVVLRVFDGAGKLLAQHSPQQGSKYDQGVVDGQGNLYLGGTNCYLYAYSPAGTELWRCVIPNQTTQTQASLYCTPALGINGKLYAVTDIGMLAVLTRAGKIELTVDIGQAIYTEHPPAIAPDGGLYLVSVSQRPPDRDLPINFTYEIIRVSSHGEILWHHPTQGYEASGLMSNSDGSVYFYYVNDKFYAVNSDNCDRWEYYNTDPMPENGRQSYAATLDDDGRIYVASGTCLSVFSPAGTIGWSQHLPGDCGWPLYSNGKIYVQVYQEIAMAQASNMLSQNPLWSRLHLPNFSFGESEEIYVIDKPSGEILKRYNLPRHLRQLCGPGPDGEFYARHTIFHPFGKNSEYEIVRIDLK